MQVHLPGLMFLYVVLVFWVVRTRRYHIVQPLLRFAIHRPATAIANQSTNVAGRPPRTLPRPPEFYPILISLSAASRRSQMNNAALAAATPSRASRRPLTRP